jgi:deoxyribodipyrimidine photolyase
MSSFLQDTDIARRWGKTPSSEQLVDHDKKTETQGWMFIAAASSTAMLLITLHVRGPVTVTC